jgi:hypothetical protein
MFAQHSRAVLLAGLLTAVLLAPAWAADGDAAKAEPTGADLPLAAATALPVQPGPVVARESLTNEARATVMEGESQPSRTYGNPLVGRRYAGRRSRGGAGVAYAKPGYRYSLMLGIGY